MCEPLDFSGDCADFLVREGQRRAWRSPSVRSSRREADRRRSAVIAYRGLIERLSVKSRGRIQQGAAGPFPAVGSWRQRTWRRRARAAVDRVSAPGGHARREHGWIRLPHSDDGRTDACIAERPHRAGENRQPASNSPTRHGIQSTPHARALTRALIHVTMTAAVGRTLAHAKSRRFHVVVCWRLDRLGRPST